MTQHDGPMILNGPEGPSRLAQAVLHLAEEAQNSGLLVAASVLSAVRDALLEARSPDKPAA
ncbi:hypothetical protein [Muricoccus radiodurans]|uniref:hypothetical protein n=1 Tax=Muricoccus radiodurans TaxID=2231721 RepID=UPI003CEFCFEF